MSGGKNEACWSIDEYCCDLILEGQPASVHLRARMMEEAYHSHTAARKFVPLTVMQGGRTAILAHFYIPDIPDAILTISDAALARGRSRQARIGDGQAWFYHEDHILLVWRCNLLERYRPRDPVDDENLHALWDGFEAFLRRCFPHAGRIVVPAWNLPYDQARWKAFLYRHGFIRASPAALPGRAVIKDLDDLERT